MKALEKELKKIEKAEARMRQQAEKKSDPAWKGKLEEKIPDKVMSGLQKAFSKAFYLKFDKFHEGLLSSVVRRRALIP